MVVLQTVFVIIILLLLFYVYKKYIIYGLKYSSYNTKLVAPCSNCEMYKVHQAHDKTEEAAKLLAEINKRNLQLIEHLENKYTKTNLSQPDPFKNGRIDVIAGTEMYSSDTAIASLKNQMNQEYIQERVTQLVQNYNPNQIYEISPKNTGNATSYTEDKKILVLCLRHKEPNAQGNNELHDINTMMFVVLHELSHMANKSWGHAVDFWALFKFLLLNASEAGIYSGVNYGVKPITYCGLLLHYNPLFDAKI
jgi:hypothetical protein